MLEFEEMRLRFNFAAGERGGGGLINYVNNILKFFSPISMQILSINVIKKLLADKLGAKIGANRF